MGVVKHVGPVTPPFPTGFSNHWARSRRHIPVNFKEMYPDELQARSEGDRRAFRVFALILLLAVVAFFVAHVAGSSPSANHASGLPSLKSAAFVGSDPHAGPSDIGTSATVLLDACPTATTCDVGGLSTTAHYFVAITPPALRPGVQPRIADHDHIEASRWVEPTSLIQLSISRT